MNLDGNRQEWDVVGVGVDCRRVGIADVCRRALVVACRTARMHARTHACMHE